MTPPTRTPIQQAVYTLRGTAHGLTMDEFHEDAERLEKLADAVEAEDRARNDVQAFAIRFVGNTSDQNKKLLEKALKELSKLQQEQK